MCPPTTETVRPCSKEGMTQHPIQQSIKVFGVSLTGVQYGNALGGGVGANGSVNGLTVHPGRHSLLSVSNHPVLHHSWRYKEGVRCFHLSRLRTWQILDTQA